MNNFKDSDICEFTYFDSALALAIGTYIANKAIKNDDRLSVDISVNNKVLFHFASDNSTPDTEHWIQRKKKSVLHFHLSTNELNKKNKGDESLLSTKYGMSLTEATFTPGGVPIKIKGVGVVGAIVVSGLKAHEDHDLIIEAIQAIK